MQCSFISFLLLWCTLSFGQGPEYGAIDRQMQQVSTPDLDSLARYIHSKYDTEAERVRAVFSWMATHISYHTRMYNSKNYVTTLSAFGEDTTTWKSADEMVAERVFARKFAVCDGYARLFRVLCEKAGLEAEIILGYARGYAWRPGHFRTNHSWNAVRVDGQWKLVDVTWAAGYVNWKNEYVPLLDDYFFFTPPDQLIKTHFPENSHWTLLGRQPSFSDFHQEPFRARAFVKYGIAGLFPMQGTIRATVGDTIVIRIVLHDLKKSKTIATSSFTGCLPEPQSGYGLLEPHVEIGNTLYYFYYVQSTDVHSLNLYYNKDFILQYALAVKERSGEAMAKPLRADEK